MLVPRSVNLLALLMRFNSAWRRTLMVRPSRSTGTRRKVDLCLYASGLTSGSVGSRDAAELTATAAARLFLPDNTSGMSVESVQV